MSRRITRRTRKIAALAAGLLVVGIGATYTLASWNDSEWVWGGAGAAPGIGTGSFEIEQNTTADLADEAAWVDRESNPGGSLTFAPGALSLSPGDSVYAPVSLRAKEGSIAGTVTLQAAVKATGIATQDTGDLLWSAVDVSVYTSNAATAPACTSAGIASWGQPVAPLTDAPLATTATDSQSLPAGANATTAGAPQHYCFVVTLPSGSQTGTGDQLMNRTIAPAWEFRAVSV